MDRNARAPQPPHFPTQRINDTNKTPPVSGEPTKPVPTGFVGFRKNQPVFNPWWSHTQTEKAEKLQNTYLFDTSSLLNSQVKLLDEVFTKKIVGWKRTEQR
jgi:hypothetical protein